MRKGLVIMNKNALYLAIFGILCVLAGVLVGANIGQRSNMLWSGKQRPHFREHAEYLMGYGQNHVSGKRFGEKFTGMLIDKLSLDNEQKTKVTQILDDTRLKIDEVGKNVRSSIVEIRQNADKQIMEILTPEQQDKFKSMQEEFQKKHGFRKTMKKHNKYMGQIKNEAKNEKA